MTSRGTRRAPWILVAAASLTTVLAGCAGSTPADTQITTISSAGGCSSAPTVDNLKGLLTMQPDAVIVSGALKATGTAEKINREGGGTWVVSQYELTTSEVLAGSTVLGSSTSVWALGGRAGNTQQDLEQSTYTDSSGAGVFAVQPNGLPGKTLLVGSFPLSNGSVVLGYGCSNSKGLSAAKPGKPANVTVYDLDTANNRLAPATDAPSQGLAQVSLNDFKAAIKTS